MESSIEHSLSPLTFESIKDVMVEMLTHMGVDYSSVVVEERSGRVWIEITPKEEKMSSLYIGYRGQNLSALQHIFIQLLWNKGLPKETFVVLDIDGYKRKNEEKVLDIVLSKIEALEVTSNPQIMPFLEAQERRMVHLYILNNHPTLQTESFTDERGKRVLKIMKKPVQQGLSL